MHKEHAQQTVANVLLAVGAGRRPIGRIMGSLRWEGGRDRLQ